MNIRAVSDAATIGEILQVQADLKPDSRWLTLLVSGGAERHLTYGELFDRSRMTAAGLVESGVLRGDRVIIILPTCVDFFPVFWGILLHGAIPVPLYPPFRPNDLERYGAQLSAIVDNCGASVAVTDGAVLKFLKWMERPLSKTVRFITPRELLESGRTGELVKSDPGDTALIQYTSGSTGLPKGVDLAHRNLLANIRAVVHRLDFRSDDVGVSWLPLYHDMGLIGAVMGTLHHSIPLVLIPPQDFIRSPKLWIQAIHKYRGTLSAAPNFAYSLTSRKIRDHDMEGVDLSCWRVAISGAEQIHPGTLDLFSRRFAPYGFQRKAFVPAYGLAEAALAVTFGVLEEEPVVREYAREGFEAGEKAEPAGGAEAGNRIQWVSVGREIPGHSVRIVDPEGREVPERTVGEVAIHGPSLMKGYYRRPEATAEVLRGGWLYSGDLGFLDEGDLFITGRSKEMIITGGRNFYPHDIEMSASGVEGVRPGCVSAFGVPRIEQGTEDVVLIAETRVGSAGRRRAMVHEIRKAVQRDTGCGPDQILLVPPGSIPKTSSGKIQRYLCRDRFLDGNLGKKPAPPWWIWSRRVLARLVRGRRA